MKALIKQHGVALLIFVVVMATAAAAVTVKALNNASANYQIARDKITAAALTQAKDALIGRAASDANRPGSLPCPDIMTNTPNGAVINVPNDGIADSFSGPDCPSYIGYLPWRTLGLPDLRDGSGERLWYVLSSNFKDYNSPPPLNSELLGLLNIGGTQTTNNAIAIVFSPGSTLPGQNRSATQVSNCLTTGTQVAANLCAANYLEGSNANLNTLAALNLNYQTTTSSATFNDKLASITPDQLFPVIEKRIGRDVKVCLDAYASSSSQKYPWPAPLSDVSTYLGKKNSFFGRLPTDPSFITLTSDANANSLISELSALQIALNNYAVAQANYQNSNTASNLTAFNSARTILNNTGNTLAHFHNQGLNPVVSNTSVNTANYAGNMAQDLAQIHPESTVNAVQTAITNTRSSLVDDGLLDSVVTAPWPASCTIFTSNYWPNWQNLVFYQVADGYKPGGNSNCDSCLSISGSGNAAAGSGTYRAAVLVARRAIGTQLRTFPATDPPTPYLEGINPHSGLTPATGFETYRLSDPHYSNVNDLVLCLDGRNNCK